MEAIYYLVSAASLSALIMALLASAGEPTAVWLVCDVMGFNQACEGGKQ